MRKYLTVVLAVALLAGCAHRQGGGSASPYEQTLASNDVLAQTNNTVAKGVIAAQQSGLLPVPDAAIILKGQRRVAEADKALSQILAQGPQVATTKVGEVQGYLAEVKQAATDIINSGVAGVKNPKSQQTFAADANAVISLVANITTELAAAGVIR